MTRSKRREIWILWIGVPAHVAAILLTALISWWALPAGFLCLLVYISPWFHPTDRKIQRYVRAAAKLNQDFRTASTDESRKEIGDAVRAVKAAIEVLELEAETTGKKVENPLETPQMRKLEKHVQIAKRIQAEAETVTLWYESRRSAEEEVSKLA